MTRKYKVGETVKIKKDPPGLLQGETLVGMKATIEKVKVGEYIQVAGYRFYYVTASRFIQPTNHE